MTAAAGPYLAACILLGVAGVAKARDPDPTGRFLATLLPGRRAVPSWVVRAAGVLESGLGALAVVGPAPEPAAAVALSYLVFAAFVVASLVRTGGEAGCGCFGEAGADVPLGPLHAVVDLALATAAVVVAGAGGLQAGGLERAVVTLAAGGLAWATYLALVPLPLLLAGVRDRARAQ